jgi:hypothetical protein
MIDEPLFNFFSTIKINELLLLDMDATISLN